MEGGIPLARIVCVRGIGGEGPGADELNGGWAVARPGGDGGGRAGALGVGVERPSLAEDLVHRAAPARACHGTHCWFQVTWPTPVLPTESVPSTRNTWLATWQVFTVNEPRSLAAQLASLAPSRAT